MIQFFHVSLGILSLWRILDLWEIWIRAQLSAVLCNFWEGAPQSILNQYRLLQWRIWMIHFFQINNFKILLNSQFNSVFIGFWLCIGGPFASAIHRFRYDLRFVCREVMKFFDKFICCTQSVRFTAEGFSAELFYLTIDFFILFCYLSINSLMSTILRLSAVYNESF